MTGRALEESSGLGWFVAIAKPKGHCKATTDHRDRLCLTGDGGLFAAERELLFMGFDVFVPRDRFLRMHRGERLQFQRALLNRYMFVRGGSVHLERFPISPGHSR